MTKKTIENEIRKLEEELNNPQRNSEEIAKIQDWLNLLKEDLEKLDN